MAAVACCRSVFRSSSLRSGAAKLFAEAKTKAPSSSPFRLSSSSKRTLPTSPSRFLRSPLKMSSCCVESLLPLHSATASALLTSMLADSGHRYGWLSEVAQTEDC